MMLIEKSPVPAAALPLVGFKDHLRLGSGFADDGVQDETLETFLRAALASIEARTGKVLIERDYRWTVTAWRGADRQPLPLAPVSAIVDMVQIDRQGLRTPVAQARYGLEPDMQRPAIVATGSMLPAVPQGGRIEIDLMAGFGPDWSDLPADLAQAVLLLAAHFHEYRSDAALNGVTMPFSVTGLIERYRTVRLFMGGADMTAPLLNRKLVLEQADRVADGSGGHSEVWLPLGTLWAEIKAGTGSARVAQALTLSRVPLRITVRAAPAGAPSRPVAGQRMREDTRVFAILAVAEADRAGRYLVCHATEEVVS